MASLSQFLVNLVQENSKNLAEDLRKHLQENNKNWEFEVDDIYPLLYDSITKELSEQFLIFNKDRKYTKEIENGKYDSQEKRLYYDYLFLETASRLMKFKEK